MRKATLRFGPIAKQRNNNGSCQRCIRNIITIIYYNDKQFRVQESNQFPRIVGILHFRYQPHHIIIIAFLSSNEERPVYNIIYLLLNAISHCSVNRDFRKKKLSLISRKIKVFSICVVKL